MSVPQFEPATPTKQIQALERARNAVTALEQRARSGETGLGAQLSAAWAEVSAQDLALEGAWEHARVEALARRNAHIADLEEQLAGTEGAARQAVGRILSDVDDAKAMLVNVYTAANALGEKRWHLGAELAELVGGDHGRREFGRTSRVDRHVRAARLLAEILNDAYRTIGVERALTNDVERVANGGSREPTGIRSLKSGSW